MDCPVCHRAVDPDPLDPQMVRCPECLAVYLVSAPPKDRR